MRKRRWVSPERRAGSPAMGGVSVAGGPPQLTHRGDTADVASLLCFLESRGYLSLRVQVSWSHSVF